MLHALTTITLPRHLKTGWLQDIEKLSAILALNESPVTILGVAIRYAVHIQYLAVYFLPRTEKRHPIARPWGRGMGCLLWCHSLNKALTSFILFYVQYHIIFVRHISRVFSIKPMLYIQCPHNHDNHGNRNRNTSLLGLLYRKWTSLIIRVTASIIPSKDKQVCWSQMNDVFLKIYMIFGSMLLLRWRPLSALWVKDSGITHCPDDKIGNRQTPLLIKTISCCTHYGKSLHKPI